MVSDKDMSILTISLHIQIGHKIQKQDGVEKQASQKVPLQI